MSLSTTSHIKSQLTNNLASKAPIYFTCLQKFVTGRISRTEFDDTLKPILDAPYLIQLHNALIISLFDARSHKRPVTPPPDQPKPPPRKRRRTLPYQGPDTADEDLGSRSSRLKRWAISLGKAERERIRALPSVPPLYEPRKEITEEIQRERPLYLPKERDEPPGSRPSISLSTMSRAPTVQHITERINLVCAQHNLHAPQRNVATLMHLACEVKLKQLITHALTLTTQSLAISSVSMAKSSQSSKILSTAALEALFTISPADLPNKSAAVMRSALGDRDEDDEDDGIPILKNREVKNPRWQIAALLAQRSAVRETLLGLR
ncbi:transcriptional regulator of RNA polII, SAGA, subunit-domain-containing protein [Lentinula edodes]|uniref:transcriptional regulator of RNA polII, SAGA, subunit-domain-containing protein n=1 Tax=Lentinula edodes TaxID=5353 RepID=UPI001E8E79EC|nr:transcriptional regulator of RNA polII, SAGA, subunit-domain-containing protein [Lentinula edodes]KAH7879138.1 transcriptional regulator of RNA polII, SAGA, subunit-domain-containing protein [Lentinula edodes]KAJ3901050.1 transcriptional regulator of RNA polII, SAGA, subunit-domain-containing protein [Lentinula edodes]